MLVAAFISPSMPEALIAVMIGLVQLSWWIGVPYMLWLLLKRQREAAGHRIRGEGVFTETVVDGDGVLRTDLVLGLRWAGRAARIVIEPIEPL